MKQAKNRTYRTAGQMGSKVLVGGCHCPGEAPGGLFPGGLGLDRLAEGVDVAQYADGPGGDRLDEVGYLEMLEDAGEDVLVDAAVKIRGNH